LVLAEFPAPNREILLQTPQYRFSTLQLNAVSLSIVETDGFDFLKAFEGPGKACGRVLAAGMKD
jgi:hypothetical protein